MNGAISQWWGCRTMAVKTAPAFNVDEVGCTAHRSFDPWFGSGSRVVIHGGQRHSQTGGTTSYLCRIRRFCLWLHVYLIEIRASEKTYCDCQSSERERVTTLQTLCSLTGSCARRFTSGFQHHFNVTLFSSTVELFRSVEYPDPEFPVTNVVLPIPAGLR